MFGAFFIGPTPTAQGKPTVFLGPFPLRGTKVKHRRRDARTGGARQPP